MGKVVPTPCRSPAFASSSEKTPSCHTPLPQSRVDRHGGAAGQAGAGTGTITTNNNNNNDNNTNIQKCSNTCIAPRGIHEQSTDHRHTKHHYSFASTAPAVCETLTLSSISATTTPPCQTPRQSRGTIRTRACTRTCVHTSSTRKTYAHAYAQDRRHEQ